MTPNVAIQQPCGRAKLAGEGPSSMAGWAAAYSRERDASQCEKPTKVAMEPTSTATTIGTEATPSRSKIRTGTTEMATQSNKTTPAKACAKLMVHPIQRRRRGTMTRGSSAHRYTMLQLFGLAQSRSRSSRVTAEVLYDARGVHLTVCFLQESSACSSAYAGDPASRFVFRWRIRK